MFLNETNIYIFFILISSIFTFNCLSEVIRVNDKVICNNAKDLSVKK